MNEVSIDRNYHLTMHSLVKISGVVTVLDTQTFFNPPLLLVSGDTVLPHSSDGTWAGYFWPRFLHRKGCLEMQTLLVLPRFYRHVLYFWWSLCFTSEPCIILEVDTFNKTRVVFFLVSLLTVWLIFNYQIIEKLAFSQPNSEHLSQVLD